MYYKHKYNVPIICNPCSDDSSICIHSDDEIAPVAYLQLKQLSLAEKTERVGLNQPVLNHSSFYMEKFINKSSQSSAEGTYVCSEEVSDN